MNLRDQIVSLLIGLTLLVVRPSEAAPQVMPDPPTYDAVSKSRNYLCDSWQTEDGLSQRAVTALTQDPRGYLWIGTQEGIVRFDGYDFKLYDRNQTDLPSNWVQALLPDTDAGLWVATRRGLAHYHGSDESFHSYAVADGLPHRDIRAFHRDQQGRLWIGTLSGLTRLDQEEPPLFTHFSEESTLADHAVYDLLEDRRGALWIATDAGLTRFREDATEASWTVQEGLPNNTVYSLAEDDEGSLWIGTAAGLARLDGSSPEEIRPDLFGNSSVRSLLASSRGSLWVGTDHGLYLYEQGSWTIFDRDDGLPGVQVRALWEDDQGGLWVGLWDGALARLRKTPFAHYGTDEGLLHSTTWSFAQSPDRSVWVGSDGGMTQIRGERIRTFPLPGESQDNVTALLDDREGHLWIGTWEEGLLRMSIPNIESEGVSAANSRIDSRPEIRVAQLEDNRNLLHITRLLLDDSKNLWIATDGRGVHRRTQDGTLRTFTTDDGLPSNVVKDLYLDPTDNLWLAVDGGLVRHPIVEDPPLFEIQPNTLNLAPITSIYGDDEGTLWLTTEGDGLARFRGGEVFSYSTTDGLHENILLRVLEDPQDHLWLIGEKGLSRVAKKSLEDFAAGRIARYDDILYNDSAGLLQEESTGGALLGDDGRLWFSTIDGIRTVDPRDLTAQERHPPVLLTMIDVDRERFSPQESLVLPPSVRDIVFHYDVIAFNNSEQAHSRFRLEGYEESWSRGTLTRTARYTNLPPGDYIFRVQTAYREGRWSEGGVAFSFQIPPAFYQTKLFYFLCVLSAGLVGWIFHLLLVRRLLAHNRNLQQMQRDLVTQHAELTRFIYTLSHDLKNPLLTIRAFVGAVEQQIGPEQGSRIQADLERIRSASGQLENRIDQLLEVSRIGRQADVSTVVDFNELARESIQEFSETIEAKEIEVIIHENLPRVWGDRKRLAEVFYNLIENAIKFSPVESPRIEIGTTQRRRRRVCFVRDNGVGIDPRYQGKIFDLFHQLNPDTQGTGVGLAAVQQIVELHRGKIWVTSELGKGSTFTFYIPEKEE